MTQTTTLYRPVGLKELHLIIESGMRTFPPRLDHQPIFYPVMNEDYATQIARDWNTKDIASDYAGFVTAFDLPADYLARFEIHTVGNKQHQELWVPAEQLDDFNAQITGPIRVLSAFYGDNFSSERPSL